MRVLLTLFGVSVLLAGCASGGTSPRPEVAAALDRLAADAAYAATKRCLSTAEYDSVEILDDRHLLFKSATGNSLWLNELRHRCPGLRVDDTLLFEMNGNRLCSLDSATVIDRFMFWERSGPSCGLGEFHELTDAQASLLREATKG